MTEKLRIATCSLAGCFGCHMSLLDIDERILSLAEKVTFDRTPLTDIKHCGPCDIGLIEGGLCNEENVEVLQEFRKNCRILVAVGACAINGGLPAMRNGLTAQACLDEAYRDGIGLAAALEPNDPELPQLLPRVLPLQEVVDLDYSLPGCPPSADAFWSLLTALVEGREPKLAESELRFD